MLVLWFLVEEGAHIHRHKALIMLGVVEEAYYTKNSESDAPPRGLTD